MSSTILKLFVCIFCTFSASASYGAADITIPKPNLKINKGKGAKAKIPDTHPEMIILGKKVIPGKRNYKAPPKTVDELPKALRSERVKSALSTRKDITVYKHNPTLGPTNAPISIIEMTDLNCLQCMSFLKDADKVLEMKKYKDKIKRTYIHLPVDLYNSTNPAAFYGKIAQEQGVFWQYRKELFSIDEIKDNTFIDKLVKVGGDPTKIRNLVRKNARKFYKELDADAMLAKNTGETRPPVIFVNGIKVGFNIKVEELSALLDYELGL